MKFYGMDEAGERERAADEDETPVDSLVMATATEYVEVVCIVVPTGENFWLEAAKGQGYMRQVIDKWKVDHPEFEGTPCNMGAVHITMPRDKYTAIGAHFGPGCFVWA